MRPTVAAAVACMALALPAPAGAFTAPDPGGDETASVEFPPPGKYMGFNDDQVGGMHGLATKDYLELTRTVGGNAVRQNIDWRLAEPAQGQWDARRWGEWKVLYDGALRRGIVPIFVVGMAPEWAREPAYQNCPWFGACEYPPARQHDADWTRYVSEVARQFPQAIIEVWNEPNLTFSWESGPDPERFAELQVLAYDAVNAVSPSTMVLAGGLSNVQQTADGHIALREFLDRAYRADPSIRGHMDAISFHPYPWGLSLGADTLFAKSFDDVRTVRDANGDAGTPLLITEIGIPTITNFVSEQQQADLMLRLYRRAMTMNDVIGVIYHRAIEPKDTTSDPLALGYAWTRYGQNPPIARPVYCGFVVAAARSYPGCPGELSLNVNLEPAPGTIGQGEPISFSFESPNYGATYQCSLDSASWAACWPPKTYLPDRGSHTFRVRSVDLTGQPSPSRTHNFRVRR